MNKPEQVFAIPTSDGLIDVQGHRVYSAKGIAIAVTSEGKGLLHNNAGLVLEVKHVSNSTSDEVGLD